MKTINRYLFLSVFMLLSFCFVNKSFAEDSKWETINNLKFSFGIPRDPHIAVDNKNIPYVAYTDCENDYKLTVVKYNDSSWGMVGVAGASPGLEGYTAFAIDNNNIPYVAYADEKNGNRITVMKYNGSLFQIVGVAGFSTGPTGHVSLAIDNNNIPYVAYTDGSGKITVMKYNGSSWEIVGVAGFSAGKVWKSNILAIDNNNIPYIAYQDVQNGSKTTVMKYNGSSWEVVGIAGFSAGAASGVSFAIDDKNIPYVVYANDSKATVVKYNNSSWEIVGVAGFTVGGTNNISLAIDNNNIPYVAYPGDPSWDRATVVKYNGSSWEVVGIAGFSAGDAFDVSLTIDNSNVLYVVYTDFEYINSDLDYKIKVMKYLTEKVPLVDTIINPRTTTPTIGNAPSRLHGQLLLATEDHGRIWYVDLTGKRHEVTFANALSLFQKLSLGISNKDLNNIPLNTENKTSEIGNKQRGKLLLATEDHGRIWYVDLTGKRHEVTFANLINLFTKLSLGISNADLNKISAEETQEIISNTNTDQDKDGLTDPQEAIYKTDPKNKDTDGDGYLDGDEVKNGYDPLKGGNAKLEAPNTGKEAALNDKGSTLKSIGNQVEDGDIQLLSWDWMSSNRKDLTPEQNKEILVHEISLRRIQEKLIGLRYGIGDFFNLSPTSTIFKNDVYINIAYTDDEIKGINENELSIYSEDENGQWAKVSSTINLASNTITAKINGAGTYTAGAPYNPDKIDSDNDGLTDSEELNTYKTNPDNPDSDEDGYLDGDEVKNGYNPLKGGGAKL